MTTVDSSPPREVPAFEANELSPRRSRYCICTFVINEGERIRAQLMKMGVFADKVDIIIGDGGSTDGSLDEEFLRAQGVSILLTKRGPGKLSAQMRMALSYALDRGYEGVIVVDGNGKDDLNAVASFVQALDDGFDHIQGSRYIAGGIAENTPFLRHIGVNILHAPLISLASGFRYTDTTNGFRAYSAKFLADPRVQPFRNCFVGYELHYYLAIRAARLGFKVKEIPVTRRYPSHGATPTKISPFKGNLKVLETLGRAVLGQFNPPEIPRA